MKTRIKKLQKRIEKMKLDGLLVSDPFNIRYLSDFIGLAPYEREAWLLLTRDNAFLLTNPLYFPQASKLKAPSKVLMITPEKPLTTYLNQLLPQKNTLGFEPSSLSVQEYSNLRKKCEQINFAQSDGLI